MYRGEAMTVSALRVRATVCMQSASNLPVSKSLMAGWGPVVYFQDRFYVGRILECKNPIEPGGVGEALIGLMVSQVGRMGLQEGSVLELRDGPKTLIATATVLSYTIV